MFKHQFLSVFLTVLVWQNCEGLKAQTPNVPWIRPANEKALPVWGIQNGIVFGLWPAAIEAGKETMGGGPRGLIRLGYEYKGKVYHINYLAIEPVVNGKMEFSEISPSQIDQKWGKLMWAGDHNEPDDYYPAAKTTGRISHPDPKQPDIEELSVYVFMERFLNGAHPYLKLSVRSDRPEELCIEIFHEKNSAVMERCAVTATMGNYSRLRMLYLKNRTEDSRSLYKDFKGIDFIEKAEYPAEKLLRDSKGDFMAIVAPSETFNELSAWPQQQRYQDSWGWRYRPFFMLSQYWRKEQDRFDPSLRLRVNGRAKYWSGGSPDPQRYIEIPGGPAFENFELREKYYEGEKFYFGISRKSPGQLIAGNKDSF